MDLADGFELHVLTVQLPHFLFQIMRKVSHNRINLGLRPIPILHRESVKGKITHARFGGRFCQVQGVNFSEAILTDALFVGARMGGANLQWAEASGSDFTAARLTWVLAYGANFQGASFKDANLVSAQIVGADLRGANFQGSNLMQANFNQSNLLGAQFKDSNFDETLFYSVRNVPTEIKRVQ